MDLKKFFEEKIISNNQMGEPFVNFYEEQKYIGNLLKNNLIEKQIEDDIKTYLKNKFFQNNFTSLVCRNKSKCHDFSYQNDFEYNLCKEAKSLFYFSFYEITLILLFIILFIKILFI